MSDVNGLGVYLLCSLGFVFSALVEFTIIITIKRRTMNRRMSRNTNPKSWTRKIIDADREGKKRESFYAATAKYKRSKAGQGLHDDDKSTMEETDMALLRKIDFASFLAYLSGYILFNCCYWVNMITKE